MLTNIQFKGSFSHSPRWDEVEFLLVERIFELVSKKVLSFSEFNFCRSLFNLNNERRFWWYFTAGISVSPRVLPISVELFCGMVDRRKALFSLISSRDHFQRSSPTRIPAHPRQDLNLRRTWSLDFVECSGDNHYTTAPIMAQITNQITAPITASNFLIFNALTKVPYDDLSFNSTKCSSITSFILLYCYFYNT